MDFTLSDEQELVRTTARSLLVKECPPSLVRARVEDQAAPDTVWAAHLREWVALGDGPLVDLCLFLEETGAVLLPGPYFADAALFVPLLRSCGHPLADAAADGDVSGTVAMAGASGEWAVNDDPLRTFVLDADRVEKVAVVLPGPAVLVVDTAPLELRRVETLDLTRGVFDLDVPADRAAAVPISTDALDGVVARGTVALAAEMVGVSRWLVDTAVAYSKERVQFGRPIGSFQGLQFKMVDMALDHERAAAAVAYAAMALDADDPDAARAVHVAKAAAGAAARHAAKDSTQIHGGIGYTWESDVHLYLRRAYADDYLLGSSTWHHDRLADLLLG